MLQSTLAPMLLPSLRLLVAELVQHGIQEGTLRASTF